MQFKPTPDFFLAGRAIFTVVSPAKEHYTYRVDKKLPSDRYPKEAYLVQLLSGCDNSNDYITFALLDKDSGRLRLTKSSNFTEDSLPLKVAAFVFDMTWNEGNFRGLRIDPPDRCSKCSKRLTAPFEQNPYRLYGFGPECGPRVIGKLA